MDYEFQDITDLLTAKETWNAFNLQASAFDTWDLRVSFFHHTASELHFFSVLKKGVVVAFFPMQRNKDTNALEIFGGSAMEDNTLFWDEEDIETVRILLDAIREPFHIQYCRDLTYLLPLFESDKYVLNQDNEKFILDFKKIINFDHFLQRFSSKSKAQLRKKIQIFEKEGVTIQMGDKNDVKNMILYNIEKFGEQSVFNMTGKKEAFLDLASLSATKILRFELNNIQYGVSMCIFSNGCLAYLNAGITPEAPSNFGTYMVIKNIEYAIELKAAIFDAGAYSFNWKERMHFDRIPMWEFSKIFKEVGGKT